MTPKEPTEKTRDLYRFAVEAKPGEPAKLAVSEERIDRQQVAINEPRRQHDPVLPERKVVSDKVKAALAEIVKRKQHRAGCRPSGSSSSSGSARSARTSPASARTWPNSTAQSDVYKNYVKKFSDQESRRSRSFAPRSPSFEADETNQRKALDEYPSWGSIWPAVTTGHQSQRSRASMQSLRCTWPLC